MNLSNNNQGMTAEQRDFWDSLQMDILTSNPPITREDYLAFTERNFMFSIFFRGCSALEIVSFKSILGLKDYAYLILLDLFEPNKTNFTTFAIDDLELHHFIKKLLPHKNCSLGPLLSNRLSILISEDSILSDSTLKEESTKICLKLAQEIEQHFHLKVSAGIGSMHSINSIYTSFTDALACNYNSTGSITFYLDLKNLDLNIQFDYLATQKHLLEAVRLRKVNAYDYFSMLMDYIRPFSDIVKRNKILEILVLINSTMNLDSQSDIKPTDYIAYVMQLMNYSGDQLIDYGYQLFIYMTSYVKPQNSIDYSNHIVKATKEYLENHYADDISLENMADHVNISPQYFSKLIKKTTGFNFIDWLSMLRVKKAKELLTNSNLTVKEVCYLVGYKDPNYFSRIFKKRIGITPSEYVKANSFLNNKN